MKKNRIFIAVTFIFVLTFLTLGQTDLSYGAGLNYVKVGLKYASSSVSEADISADGGLAIASYSSSGFTNAIPITANGSTVKFVTAVNENGAVVLKDEGKANTLATVTEDQAIVSADGGNVKFDNSPYRGGIVLKTNLSKLDVINAINIEHYIYGVLAAEIGTGSPMETIKAQAVAARSFAGASEGAHKSNGFDLCSTTHCQVYKGVAKEHANTNKATDETQGLMIYSGGKPVNAYYAKNSGGHTQNSEDVWYATLPYLRGIKDTYAPDYPWEATMTFAELKSKLENSGHKPGEIQSVSVTKRSAANAVYTLVIIGSENTVTLQKDSIRTTLGGSLVKSLMFQFVGSQSSGGQNAAAPTSEFTYVISSNGQVTKVATNTIYTSNGTTSVKWSDAGGGAGSNEVLETVTEGTLYFKGNGYGHGLGLQQDGAIAMGKEGLKYDEILKFYYTGIEIL